MQNTYNEEIINKDIIVIYHKHCQDGFGAAYAAYRKFGDNACYIPCNDRVIPPEGLVNKEIYIVDFSYPKEVLLNLQENNKRVVNIDHHISSKEAVESLKEYVFSIEHSGSYLAWEYFVSKDVPEFIKILEIIDLKKDTDHGKADVITYILSKPYTFESYENLLNDFEDESKMEKIKEIGRAQNDYLELIIGAVISEPDFVEFEGYTIPCINFSLPLNEKSIALSEMYAKYPPFAMSYRYDNGKFKVSLRGNGEVDLNLLASKYGGGGHKSSAGFVIDADYPLSFATQIKRIISK